MVLVTIRYGGTERGNPISVVIWGAPHIQGIHIATVIFYWRLTRQAEPCSWLGSAVCSVSYVLTLEK